MSGRISFGSFLLDLQRGELLRGGELVALAPKPLAVLAYLAANRDRAVPKEELRRHVWPDVFVSEAALASALKDLRRALGDDGARQDVILTLRRRGYRFVARVVAEPAPTPAEPLPPARRPPFIARVKELRQLTTQAVHAARGKPRVVILSGEAGTGKTRLLEELIAHPTCAQFSFGVGRAQAEAPVPYLPFAEALSALASDGDDASEQIPGDEAAILRPLLQPDSPSAAQLDPFGQDDALRERADLFAAVFSQLARLARAHPVLLALEDLHHADSASLALLADLVAAAAEARAAESLPLLIVVTTRPPRQDERLEEQLRRVSQSPIVTRLSIEGFGLGATRRILDSLGVESTPAVVRRIQGETGGNPLHIRALARSDAQPGAVRDAADGGYRAAVPGRRADESQGALRAVLAARIESLGPTCRAALTVGALIGERFGSFSVSCVCRIDQPTAEAHLREALSAELVVAEAHACYRFDHPLVREVLRERTGERARQELHRDIASVFQSLYATAPGEHATVIAHHLVQAGELVDQALLSDYARRAGEHAFAVCAWHEAAYFHTAAVRAGAHLTLRERALGHLRAGLAANHDYDVRGCLEHYGEAARAFDSARDDVGLAWSLMYLTRARITFPSRELGTEIDVRPLEELLERFGETHPSLRALLLGTISELQWSAGQTELAQSSAERAVAIGHLYDDGVACHHALIALGLAQLSQLRLREALESWKESAAHARRSHDLWLQATPGPRIALALLHLGRLEEARERGQLAAELARRAHNYSELGLAQANLAGLAVVCGAFDEAERSVAGALGALERSAYPWAGVYSLCARASSATHRGVVSEAFEALDLLVTPRRVFADPGASVHSMVAAYRALVTLQSDAKALDQTLVGKLVCSLPQARLDPYVLGRVCALAEVCVGLGETALAKRPEEMLRLAHDRGFAFTVGWLFLIPRVIGQLSALRESWDEAETWLDRAVTIARSSGARVELARSLVERANVRARRRDGRHESERALRDLEEVAPLCEELGLPPIARAALVLRRAIHDAGEGGFAPSTR
jgi:DNA-binding winged helix-turn-helix (wHTH) protein/tetratricopeptide (TPR) repeat protein